MTSSRQYWFPAKRYGWGWGLPATWQGWAVLIIYLAAVAALIRLAPPSTSPHLFWPLLAVATLLLGLVAWLKGEPPHWRWDKK